MKSIEEHIISINSKLQQLLKKYAALKKENETLSYKLKEKIENEKKFLEQIDSLEMQTGILKASSGKMNETDKHNFNKRINQYIKELEKCITLLNN